MIPFESFHATMIKNHLNSGRNTGVYGMVSRNSLSVRLYSRHFDVRKQSGNSVMALQLGDQVPDFTQKSSAGDINFYEWAGDSWVVLFSHPADYTPVCTTELGTVAKYRAEFDKRNVKTIALSVDGVESHKGWIGDINETQSTSVDYPILADED